MRVFCIFLIFCFSLSAQTDKPNIIFIFADDIGYEDLNCYGGLDFKTPNLDKMAQQGLRFSRMYTNPICTPSRVSMHTGTHAFRHKHFAILPVHKGTNKKVDFQKMPTFAQQLRKNGYVTSLTGKWQLATLEVWPDHIKNSGFDSWCIWQIWSKGKKTKRHWNPCFNRDGKIMKGISNKFGPDVLADYVIEKMTEATKAKKPFFILHNELLPHWPVIDTPQDRQLGRKASMGNMIEYMDKLVGKILKSVEDLGIKDNTYVFFMGDNGLQEEYFKNPKFGQPKEKRNTRHTTKGNVDGGKSDLNDAGSHVPFIVWGPKKVPAGTVNNELIDVVDLFPTFCELTNSKNTIPTDGRSIMPQIHGKVGPKREWTYQGLPSGETIFDGSWRYYIKSGGLLDARKLPAERTVPKTELIERKEIILKMKAIYKTIKANAPQAPKSITDYK
jgi:arylsulfatase A